MIQILRAVSVPLRPVGPSSRVGVAYPPAGIQPLRPGAVPPAPALPNAAPTTAVLGLASPNPSGGETTISYALPARCQQARLVLRDLLTGQPRKQVALDRQTQEVTLSVADVPAGVYSYTLVVDGAAVATRRLVVTR